MLKEEIPLFRILANPRSSRRKLLTDKLRLDHKEAEQDEIRFTDDDQAMGSPWDHVK
ncbi:hypothetical protein GCM10027027_00330 [Neomicrococcus lactis]